MYNFIILIIVLIILYAIFYNQEHFKVWDYEYPLSNMIYKDTCPIQGTIEEIDNPSKESCYRGYYIPYLFNVGTYHSEVQPQM